MTKSKNSFFSPGFSFYFWDLNFFFRALIYLNFILELQFSSFKSKNFEIWTELLLKKFKSSQIYLDLGLSKMWKIKK